MQTNASDRQGTISFEAGINASLVSHIQKTSPESSADLDVVDLIR